jgi:predicted RNase H-like HicB family nuclease
MKYLVVYEKAGNNYSAYVPDLPGCIATGATKEDVEKHIREAIEFHLSGMKEDAEDIPAPAASANFIEVEP